MRKIYTLFAVILIAAGLLAACSGSRSGGNASEPIKPGDQVGPVLLMLGEGEDFTCQWDLVCDNVDDPDKTSKCEAVVGDKVNISIGIFDDQHSGDLDKKWSNHSLELTVDDRPVDLEAFGAINITHSVMGKVRLWNVVVMANKPGKITVYQKFGIGGTMDYSSYTIRFKK